MATRRLKGDERVLGHLADVEPPSDVGIPLLVLAELLFGAEKSVRNEQNGARIKTSRARRGHGSLGQNRAASVRRFQPNSTRADDLLQGITSFHGRCASL